MAQGQGNMFGSLILPSCGELGLPVRFLRISVQFEVIADYLRWGPEKRLSHAFAS